MIDITRESNKLIISISKDAIVDIGQIDNRRHSKVFKVDFAFRVEYVEPSDTFHIMGIQATAVGKDDD